jgi:predicted transcriptional regulator
MTAAEIRIQILRALRYEPLDYWQVATDVCQAPFRVRAELRSLRREGFVKNRARVGPSDTGLSWELTDHGRQCVETSLELEKRAC